MKSVMKSRFIVLMSVILSLATPMLGQAQSPGEPIQTGDALYDRLQQAVLDEHRDDLFDGNPYGWHAFSWPWAPEVATVESWAAEFGDRADYWCLLAYVGAADLDRRELDVELLRMAAACPDADERVHQLIMRHELREIRSDESLDAWQEDARSDEIISGYLSQFPAAPWVYYEAAEQLGRYGMDARWLDMIKQGNELPGLVETELYPLSFLRGRMSAGGEVGNKAVAGSLLAMSYTQPEAGLSELFTFKDRYKEMIVGGDRIERGMTALSRQELRLRSASGIPWLCCSRQVASFMPPAVLRDLAAWQDPEEPAGYRQYMADFATFDGHSEGIHRRLSRADEELAGYLAANHFWSLLRDYEMYPVFPDDPHPEVGVGEGIGILLGQINDRSMYHRYEQEFALNRWLVDNEVPRCRAMLEHLATFDFEHPEEYVAMETHFDQIDGK